MANIRNAKLQTNVENSVRGTYNDPVIVGAMVASLVIVSWADYKNGKFPPEPKKIIAVLIVYGILGVATITDSRLSRAFAVLVTVGLLVKELPTITKKGSATVSDSTQPLTPNAPDAQAGTTPTDVGGGYPNGGTTHKNPITTKKQSGKGTHNQ